MTIYLFYLYNKSKFYFDNLNNIDISEIKYDKKNNYYYILYGFTEKKDIYKKFKKERNMNLFICKKIKLNEDLFDKFCIEYNILYLSKFYITTKYFDSGIEDNTTIPVLSNLLELDDIFYNREIIVEYLIKEDIFHNIKKLYDNNIFNNKIIKIFEKVFDINFVYECIFPFEECDYTSLLTDDFILFIRLYYKLFK